ncbi:hypothetical protein, partial [Thioclava atlantica]|uniref:hypothetical protein n=1 Tax=Thioclava atlantica TaxID=1317124 RepID=UPI001EE330F8
SRRIDQTARISLQISINFKEPEAKKNRKRLLEARPALEPQCFLPSFPALLAFPAPLRFVVCPASVRRVLRIRPGGRKSFFRETVTFFPEALFP